MTEVQTDPPVTVTTTDHETGDSETMDLTAGMYVVVCGRDRYVAHEQFYSNGTAILTIKKMRGGTI